MVDKGVVVVHRPGGPGPGRRAGVNGLHDMSATVWEWAADQRADERRTLGGSWWYPASQMRAELEAWKPADFFAVSIGFRCVCDRAAPGR